MPASVSSTSAILAAGFAAPGAAGATAPGAAGGQKGVAAVGFEALLGALLGEAQPGQAAASGAAKAAEAHKDGDAVTEDAPKDGKKLTGDTPAQDPAQPAAALFGMMAAPTAQTAPTATATADPSSSTPAQGVATPPDAALAAKVAPGLAQALADGPTPAEAAATDASALEASAAAVAAMTAQAARLPQPKAASAASRAATPIPATTDVPKAAPATAEAAPAAAAPIPAQAAATATSPPMVQAAEAAATQVAAKAPLAKDESKETAQGEGPEGVAAAGARKAATPDMYRAVVPTKHAADAVQQDLAAKPEAETSDPEATTDTAQASATTTAPASQTHDATVAGVRGSPETVAHLAAQIVKKLDGRSTRFDVALDPIGLGHVDVRIEINAHGRMSAALSCDNPQAAAELRARAGELQKALEQAGLDISGGLSFDVASDQGRQNGRNLQQDDNNGAAFRGRAFQAAMEAGDAADAATTAAATITYGRRASSGVDVRI